MPLEPSPITEDDDDDKEGMEVWLGFSSEVRLWSEPASVGQSSGTDVPAPGAAASLSNAGVSRARTYPRRRGGGSGGGEG